MNKKELKHLIKEIVRESLVEIFVEMKLESIVEGVVKKQSHGMIAESPRYIERQEAPQPRQPVRRDLKENLIKKMGISEDEWKGIYESVDVNNLPPSGGSTAMENPEFVSEDQLRQLGLL
jgi:hypothetical protein